MLDVTIGVPLIILLVAIAFLSGIGITTIGPGGIFLTIALYSLTPVSSGTVAGTAHATFISAGLVGSAVYVHSGEMKTGEARMMALILSLSSIIGALIGTYVNSFVPRTIFGLLLGIVAMSTGITIIYRERRDLSPVYQLNVARREGQVILGVLGFALGVISSLLGVGGPVIAVPALILIGVPMLLALAVAQVQSIIIATFATTGYLIQDNVSVPLVALVGLPLLAGVVVGWKVAHLIDPARLKTVLGIVLIVVGPYLTL
ncbi:sulfite exporter TauE/SafE family protein [Halorubrum sp. 48-1-W]|uniref:sulfite exporter TauE/SafE family protein n=1 Tax=Halorubrum sp. 48-1-W TaxID=2249761 RepID=UPI000DCC1685|nr:sulfite exporter TauE/SafE family protein [Halorubrum sp. 48-1-W]RAW43991.1 sulfite exporter TauE/SafE family protein [Halorubrum sp. 48-1-W]